MKIHMMDGVFIVVNGPITPANQMRRDMNVQSAIVAQYSVLNN